MLRASIAVVMPLLPMSGDVAATPTDQVDASVSLRNSGGMSLSISSLPKSQPAGILSSLHKANNKVLSQTRDMYSSDSPFRTVSPNSEPQWFMDKFRISLCVVRQTWTNMTT